MERIAGAVSGAALAGVATAAWWYGWACHTCDPGGSVAVKIAFALGLGAFLGARFSRDWSPPPDPMS